VLQHVSLTSKTNCDLGFEDFIDPIEVLDLESYREKTIFHFPLYFLENIFPKVSNRFFSEKGLFSKNQI